MYLEPLHIPLLLHIFHESLDHWKLVAVPHPEHIDPVLQLHIIEAVNVHSLGINLLNVMPKSSLTMATMECSSGHSTAMLGWNARRR